MIAAACCHSRALYLAGTWPELSVNQLAKVGSAYYRPLRMITGTHKRVPEGDAATSNAAVARQLQMPIIEWVIAISRLRFAAKVSRRPRDFLTALLQGEGGANWRSAVTASCRSLQQLLPSKLATLPDPRVSMAEWELLWTVPC